MLFYANSQVYLGHSYDFAGRVEASHHHHHSQLCMWMWTHTYCVYTSNNAVLKSYWEMMELRCMQPKSIGNTITYQFKIFIWWKFCEMLCRAILSLQPFQKRMKSNSPFITIDTKFSEFELILSSSFNGPGVHCSTGTVYRMQCNDDRINKLTKHSPNETTTNERRTQKINILDYEIPGMNIPENFCTERNACSRGFIHFDSNEIIYSYGLRCTMQILNEFTICGF